MSEESNLFSDFFEADSQGEVPAVKTVTAIANLAVDIALSLPPGGGTYVRQMASGIIQTSHTAIGETVGGLTAIDKWEIAGGALLGALGAPGGPLVSAGLSAFGSYVFGEVGKLVESLEFDPTFDPIDELSAEIHDVLPNIPLESLRAQLTELTLAHQARGGATGTPFFEDPVDALFETAEGRALLAKWEMDNQLAGMVQPTPQASYTNPRYVELRNPYSLEGPEAIAREEADAAKQRQQSSSGGDDDGPNRDKGYNDNPGNPSDKDDNPNAQPDHTGKTKPIILDLDGLGISVTELSQSTIFVDGGDGLEHRTAWAGAGDGVLFYDADGSGDLSERREYVFTEWDPTATSDLEALRSVFDLNGDGKLSGTELDNFRVMVTQADGTTIVQTMTQLGITEIDLMGDATNIELPDGSVITGQTTFTMNGQTRTVGEMVLATGEREKKANGGCTTSRNNRWWQQIHCAGFVSMKNTGEFDSEMKCCVL